MTYTTLIAVCVVLGVMCVAGLMLIAALAWVLARLDRRRYVRCLHRMRKS